LAAPCHSINLRPHPNQPDDPMTTRPQTRPPSLIHMIGALIYDWLILIGVLMMAGFVAVGFNKLVTGQDAIASGNPLYIAWNIGIVYLYFTGFWLTKRQTVGMRVWRLHIESTNNRPLGWMHCTLRFVAALPAWGLVLAGILWRYTHPERRSWQDRASWTTLRHTPKVKPGKPTGQS